MKSVTKAALAVLAAAVMLASLAACSSSIEGRYEVSRVEMYDHVFEGEELEGVFKPGENYIEIYDDSNLVVVIEGEHYDMSYTRDGNNLVIAHPDENFSTGEVTITVNGKVLTLKFIQSGLELTVQFTKQ